MHERAWLVPEVRFVEVWNAADTIDEAVARVKELAGGNVPRWAVMARAAALRKQGGEMKPLGLPAPREAVPEASGGLEQSAE